ncbi:MAG: proteasome accessory factor PafA2 [Acidimicrobiia bacterium]|nr:proteasome accessory factor PafA2 [Acidimicrobiia bacterium]NNC42442.1 proteasome accessory factor PafA2 [Acidimicrobiia bacterium]
MTTAIHKVIGTETEFGIALRGNPEFNPVLLSSILVNSYAGLRARIQWSHEEESPGRDARGYGPEGGFIPDLDSGLVNVVLANGARLYVDHAHPEYSSPECFDPLEAVLYDKAGEVVIARAKEGSINVFEDGEELLIHKNNSDGKSNSYGAHENYLLSRQVPFGDVVSHLLPFMVSRQVITGSGKLKAENGRTAVPYQITQRADFFEEEVGLETTLKRPLINTRDEPHGDPSKYRRLHVIVGDANMSEVQMLVKLGSTALMLSMIEDEFLTDPPTLTDPVNAHWQISHDPSLKHTVELDNGDVVTALNLQWRMFEQAAKYVDNNELPDSYGMVIAEWEALLTDLESDPLLTADRLDWTAKMQLLDQYRERDGLAWDDPKLSMVALQYHEIDPKRGLHNKLTRTGRMRTLFTPEQIAGAVERPPEKTRAYFRGECVRRYQEWLKAANWDSLVFDVGTDVHQRIPMMEPLNGNRELVEALLDASPDPKTLIEGLSA